MQWGRTISLRQWDLNSEPQGGQTLLKKQPILFCGSGPASSIYILATAQGSAGPRVYTRFRPPRSRVCRSLRGHSLQNAASCTMRQAVLHTSVFPRRALSKATAFFVCFGTGLLKHAPSPHPNKSQMKVFTQIAPSEKQIQS